MTLYELLEVTGTADNVCDTVYDWSVDTEYDWADIEKGVKEGDKFWRGFNYFIYATVKLEKRHNGVIVADFTRVLNDNWELLKKPIEKHFNIDLEDKQQAIEDFLYYVLKNMLWGEYSENLYRDFVNALCGKNYK